MEIIKYENNEIEIDVRFDYENNTVWLNLEQISYLFGKSKPTISRKIKELIKINNHSVVAEFATTANDNKVYKVSHYSLEIIVAIGYKINSNEVAAFKNFVESKLLENNQKPVIFHEKPYEIVTFVDDELQIDVNVDVDNDTVWLTQSQMAELFLVTKENIRQHIKNILDDNELNDSVTKNFLVPAQDGKAYNTKLYNLDMIISVGYRVNSKRGILFRKWASSILKNHLTKGYSINERRCKICQENLISLNNEVKKMNDDLNMLKSPKEVFKEKLIYEDDLLDGYLFIRKLLLSAKKEIIIIDGYISVEVLEMLEDIKVDIIIYTYTNATITKKDIKMFSLNHKLQVNRMSKIHDRFIIIDDDVYVLGSSLKDIGKKRSTIIKLTAISKDLIINDKILIQ